VVCWGTVKQLTWEARWPGTSFVPGWLADGTRAARLQARNPDLLVR
jgi:hypothetical protein